MIFPTDVDFEMDTIEVEGDFKEYALDFKTLKMKYNSSGKNIILSGVDALEVWIYKALHTVKARYKAYSEDYGNETEKLIGYNYTEELTKTELERMVSETLKFNKYIIGIYDFNCDVEGSKVIMKFKVNTVYGEVDINV